MQGIANNHDDGDDLLDDDVNWMSMQKFYNSHFRRILIKPVEVQVGGRSVVSSPHLLNVNEEHQQKKDTMKSANLEKLYEKYGG